MSSNDVAHEVEPEPNTLVAWIDPVEGFEDEVAVFLGDAWARVAYPQRPAAGDGNADRNTGAAMDKRILDKVYKGTGE